jgi:DNA gyrase/topoisomerase IV subunit B
MINMEEVKEFLDEIKEDSVIESNDNVVYSLPSIKQVINIMMPYYNTIKELLNTMNDVHEILDSLVIKKFEVEVQFLKYDNFNTFKEEYLNSIRDIDGLFHWMCIKRLFQDGIENSDLSKNVYNEVDLEEHFFVYVDRVICRRRL